MRNEGNGLVEVIVGLVIIVVIAVIGLAVYKHDNKSPTPHAANTATTSDANKSASTSTSSQNAVLIPATVPSKVAECTQQVSYAADGVPGPVQCSNGDLNVSDWQALAALEPKVLSLGYSASASQLQSDLCSDVSENISNPIELSVYQIASLYYGWNYGSGPTSILTSSACHNTDD